MKAMNPFTRRTYVLRVYIHTHHIWLQEYVKPRLQAYTQESVKLLGTFTPYDMQFCNSELPSPVNMHYIYHGEKNQLCVHMYLL